MRSWRCCQLLLLVLCLLGVTASRTLAQSFGAELHNTLMPAAGAMGGASLTRPQDLTSAMNANPATLTQFKGTQFLFGGAWVEATSNLTQASNIPIIGPDPLIEPFSAKSTAPGVPGGNIGLTQDLCELGLPATLGMGFIAAGGGAVDYRQVPESHGANSSTALFYMPGSIGVDLTDRLSIGATLGMGIAFFDGPFVGIGGMTPDYALRGTAGVNYQAGDYTSVGAYYQSMQHYRFDYAFSVPGTNLSQDVTVDLPENVGIGVANNALLDGNLLLAVDVLYKLWDHTALFGSFYDDQLVVQIGSQLTMGRVKLRAGYVWAENPIDQTPGLNLGGIVQPGDLPAVRYSQALVAVTSQNRVSLGVGVADVLPGVDMDIMGGGMFKDTEQLGPFTTSSIESYWVGLGLTWRFDRGSCERTGAPNSFDEVN
jgi:long-chain fatty acid transport protein